MSRLGNSERIAEVRFLNNEWKLEKSPIAQEQYKTVMNETLSLGHMELVPLAEYSAPSITLYYIPTMQCLKKAVPPLSCEL